MVCCVYVCSQPTLLEEVVLPLLETYQKPHPGIGSVILVATQVRMHVGGVLTSLACCMYNTRPGMMLVLVFFHKKSKDPCSLSALF